MNIFFLDKSPLYSAQYHFDRHVVKMRLEMAQMLSTVVYDNAPRQAKGLPKLAKSHYKHPSTLWLRQSVANWAYGVDLLRELNDELAYRYGSKPTVCGEAHKTLVRFYIDTKYFDDLFPFKEFTVPPQCFGNQKHLVNPNANNLDDVIEAYRKYYATKQYDSKGKDQFKWTNREKPSFLP